MEKFRVVATELITQGYEKPYQSPRVIWAGDTAPVPDEIEAAIADLPPYPHVRSHREYGENRQAYYTSCRVDVEPVLKLKKQIGFLPVSRTIEALPLSVEPTEA